MSTETPTEAQLLERHESAELFMRALDLLREASDLIDDPEYQRKYRIFLRTLREFLEGTTDGDTHDHY